MSVKIKVYGGAGVEGVVPTVAGKRTVAVVSGIDFTTIQDIFVALPKTPRFVVLAIKVISNTITTLSGGATAIFKLVNKKLPIAAALTTALTGNNNDIVLTAVTAGKAGNGITLTLVNPGANAAASVSVTGQAITVNLAYAASAITTTATQLLALLAGNAAATALVTAALAGGNDGTGIVTALSATNLTGGADYTAVSTISASAALANTDAAGTVQSPAVTSAKTLHGDYALLISITTGSTASVDNKDVVVDLLST